MRPPGLRAIGAPQGCSAIGRAAVSKTAGCRFKSCHPCPAAGSRPGDRTTARPDRAPFPEGHHHEPERGAVSDDRRDPGDDPAVPDSELTDEQIDAETPGVDDAAELEAAEDEVAA